MEADILDWVGREVWAEDVLRLQPAHFLEATLDRVPALRPGDPLPPLWHWLYFLEAEPAHALGRDGHPQKGGFLPPVALPRRMWAGGRFEFHAPLILGGDARKRSSILSVSEKAGRTGPLCFVTVRHEIYQGSGLAVVEDHDIVYRSDPEPGAPAPDPALAPSDAAFSARVLPNSTLLFRYSALTFNGHRIHYDLDYAREVEGYRGLVFHGPLTATLLVDLACRERGQSPRSFRFRGLAPIAGTAPFTLEGRPEGEGLALWARRDDGALAMSAEALF